MNFTMDFKLEPERKALIAKELGLRPRQVAIWFQNRRARWKNKQLEQDYETLKSSYEALLQENEDMVKRNKALDEENKLLQAEIARLTGISGNVDVPVDIDAKVASPDLDSDSDLESTVKGEKQQNLKSEIGIPAKLDAQSEILESLTLSCLKSQEAIVAFVEQPIGANDSVVACATVKIEAGYLSPSEETFINYPQLVHGFHVDDVLFTYENQPYGFTWDVW
ncbi:hypothetical protein KP509_20G037700 [Ceratopteris richardii]|nr:hypothetical protein KP509_20G037700 [Ceratopteris richardii]